MCDLYQRKVEHCVLLKSEETLAAFVHAFHTLMRDVEMALNVKRPSVSLDTR